VTNPAPCLELQFADRDRPHGQIVMYFSQPERFSPLSPVLLRPSTKLIRPRRGGDVMGGEAAEGHLDTAEHGGLISNRRPSSDGSIHSWSSRDSRSVAMPVPAFSPARIDASRRDPTRAKVSPWCKCARLQAAIHGIGIALLPEQVVSVPLKEGLIERVLLDWSGASNILHLVYPTPRGMLPSVRSLIDPLLIHVPIWLQERTI
jgi:LysR substrate binding domain-containing protein